jgi:hypothetical protein
MLVPRKQYWSDKDYEIRSETIKRIRRWLTNERNAENFDIIVPSLKELNELGFVAKRDIVTGYKAVKNDYTPLHPGCTFKYTVGLPIAETADKRESWGLSVTTLSGTMEYQRAGHCGERRKIIEVEVYYDDIIAIGAQKPTLNYRSLKVYSLIATKEYNDHYVT